MDLSVNVNKVALLRNSRGGERPSVIGAAQIAIEAGAYGITVHPRPDQRHVRPSDVTDLATLLRSSYPGVELNIEGNPFAGPRDNGYPGFITLVHTARPDQVTLVPDSDAQLTSDHGWQVARHEAELLEVLTACHEAGARVSLFMDPDLAEIERAAALGVERIELFTGPYAEAHRAGGALRAESLALYSAAAEYARSLGLGVNAGHDLDLSNLPDFATIDAVLEVSIGHALIADALEMGLAAAVAAYLKILTNTSGA